MLRDEGLGAGSVSRAAVKYSARVASNSAFLPAMAAIRFSMVNSGFILHQKNSILSMLYFWSAVLIMALGAADASSVMAGEGPPSTPLLVRNAERRGWWAFARHDDPGDYRHFTKMRTAGYWHDGLARPESQC